METINTAFQVSKELIEQIPANRLDTVLREGKFTLIDVRSPEGIKSQGAIPGALNIPLDEAKRQIDARHGEPGSVFNGEGPFLFCCTGGVMSYMAAIHAQENGVKQVCNLEGGHSAWKQLQ